MKIFSIIKEVKTFEANKSWKTSSAADPQIHPGRNVKLSPPSRRKIISGGNQDLPKGIKSTGNGN